MKVTELFYDDFKVSLKFNSVNAASLGQCCLGIPFTGD